jgi:hypothetical protein
MHSSWRYYLRRVSGMQDNKFDQHPQKTRESYKKQMAERMFDNRFRQASVTSNWRQQALRLSDTACARSEKVTLDEAIGPETVVMLIERTPFVHEFKRQSFALRLKSGAVQTSLCPVLFLLWWIPPVTNGKPFALYEQILNPAHIGVLEMLRQIARQTHLHLLLIGPGQELIDLYEFEGTFGLDKLISVSESACRKYRGLDFIAAKAEYDLTYELMELFAMSGEDLVQRRGFEAQ